MCYNGFIKSALSLCALRPMRLHPAVLLTPFRHLRLRAPFGPRILPSHPVALSSKLRPRKPFRCNTYGLPRKCCKQKTYSMAKSFRCNTYKKTGGGYANSSHFGTHPSLLTAFIPVLSFHALTGTPFCNSLLLLLFHVMGGAYHLPKFKPSNAQPTFSHPSYTLP